MLSDKTPVFSWLEPALAHISQFTALLDIFVDLQNNTHATALSKNIHTTTTDKYVMTYAIHQTHYAVVSPKQHKLIACVKMTKRTAWYSGGNTRLDDEGENNDSISQFITPADIRMITI